nr:retrovirus-related Pol polyprotein from transposon TNT 1-94 [Tanacetum cinerariifolium]
MEAIRIFLAFATYINFTVFQMDVKSAFLNGKLKEKVYVKQPLGFESSKFPDYVLKTPMVPPNNPGPDLVDQSKRITPNSYEKNLQSVAISLAEAEYIVVAGCCENILWMKSQLSDYDIYYKMVPIFYDNTSSIAISNNQDLHSRTKHIDIRYHFIRDHILKGEIKLHFIPTEYQLAGIFTKPLDEPTFHKEFWCIATSYDPNLPINDSKARPLKEYLIKFIVMNGKKPLILDYKTLVNPLDLIMLKDRTLVLKTTFPMAWKIWFTFVIQVLSMNYSYTEQDESFKSFATILSNSKFSKDPSKVTLIELTMFKVAVNNNEKSVNLHPFTLLPEGTTIDPKDSEGNVQPADKGLPSIVFDEGTIKTTSLPKGPHGDRDLEGFKPSADMEPLTTHVTDSTLDEVFETRDEMDEDIHHTDEEETQSPSPNKDQLESSHIQDTELDSDSSCLKALKRYDNILPLIERQLVQYLQKVYRVLYNRIIKDHWEKHKEAAILYADLKSEIKGCHDAAYKVHKGSEDALAHMRSSLSRFRLKPPSHTKGENDDMETQDIEVEKEPENVTTKEVPTRPTRAVLISTIRRITRPNLEVAVIESFSRPPLTDTILEILIPKPTGQVIDITPPEP